MPRRGEGRSAPPGEPGSGCAGGRGEAPARGLPGGGEAGGGAKARGKENAGGASPARQRARGPARGRDLGRGSRHSGRDAASCSRAERACGAAASPLSRRDNSPGRGAAAGGRRSTPGEERAEEAPDRGVWEELRGKPVDFATVTIAEFGITRESFAEPSAGKSPTSLKFRRRSAIGARGSPEHNTLIQYLAQQRSNKWKEAFAQVSPLQHRNVRLLKDKINAFQTSCEALQETEGESGFPGLPQVDDASQDAGCYCSSEHIARGVTSNAASELSRSKGSSAEVRLKILDESRTPTAPRQPGNSSLGEHKSGYNLRSLLKKRPVKQLTDGVKKRRYARAPQRLKAHVPQQRSTGSEGADFSISRATSAEKDEKTKNPRKNKRQRQKNTVACPAKRK